MGYGDEIIGTGLARGARLRGKRIAFGDGRKIDWGPWCREIFANNPNIAPPGSEAAGDLEWVHHCKGHRLYNRQNGDKWEWNYDFKVRQGEFFFTDAERFNARHALSDRPFIVMEPNLPWQKSVAPNKDWGATKYVEVAWALKDKRYDIVQFKHKNTRRILPDVKLIELHPFRQAIAALVNARLYIGPEGGMHHAAAAVGIKAVVLFGGFIPPEVMGYTDHHNLVGNSQQACGSITPCRHCRAAMDSIKADDVIDAARWYLQ